MKKKCLFLSDATNFQRNAMFTNKGKFYYSLFFGWAWKFLNVICHEPDIVDLESRVTCGSQGHRDLLSSLLQLTVAKYTSGNMVGCVLASYYCNKTLEIINF